MQLMNERRAPNKRRVRINTWSDYEWGTYEAKF